MTAVGTVLDVPELVVPSPKLHCQAVMTPFVLGVKVTASGAVPLAWLAVKSTSGELGAFIATSLEYLLSVFRVGS